MIFLDCEASSDIDSDKDQPKMIMPLLKNGGKAIGV